MNPPPSAPRRIVNIVNFIRYDEPRRPGRDLLEPVIRQMELLKAAGLPCTWLLQFDALVAGPYVEFLKANMPANHEVGLWFELNRMHCEAAGVAFRGAEGLNWDYHVQAAFSVGYTPGDRDKLADTAVEHFKRVFGQGPRVVAAWYIDAHTLGRLSRLHGVEAFAICRDQYGTDGYTFWGGPFAGGYYPSSRNTLCPAQTPDEQIDTPVFRLLGSDPIHQYDLNLGQAVQDVLTLEVIYAKGGKSPVWVRRFLDYLSHCPALGFAYAQGGQENSFGWDNMKEGYPMQVEEFARRHESGELDVETLSDTGRWFRETYPMTPPQATVALEDTLGGDRKSAWYHSRYYRLNLLLEENRLYLRDLHLFDERYAEHYDTSVCDTHAARFDTLPLLDGFGWSASRDDRALGHWYTRTSNGEEDLELELAGVPDVAIDEESETLKLSFALSDGDTLFLRAAEQSLTARLKSGRPLALCIRWSTEGIAPAPSPRLEADKISYVHRGFPYALKLPQGTASMPDSTTTGYALSSSPEGTLELRFSAHP
ncbi:MAG: hypothetical protein ACQKBW_10865 [Puniceicoccales bacterium]